MSGNNNTAWSSKFKKFRITDPFLKLITVKYEKSIPWQAVVKDESTLTIYLRDILIPELKKKTIYGDYDKRISKSFFVYYEDLDVEQILQTDELTAEEKESVNVKLNIEENRPTNEGAKKLAFILNKRKEASFQSWFEILEKKYKKNYGFQYLILKPIIEQSGYNSRRLLSAPSLSVLKWLFVRIQNEFYIPSANFGFEYRMRLSNGLNNRIINGWQFIPSGPRNTAKLTSAAARSGWCIAGDYYASCYLSDCHFYILRKNNKPIVALRVSKENQYIQEIRGVNNSVPDEFYSEIWFFIYSILDKYQYPSDVICIAYLSDMIPYFIDTITQNLEKNKANLIWWQEMIDKWPGTYDLAPEEIKTKIKFDNISFISNSFYMSLGTEFRNKYGIHFSEQDYINLLEQYPQMYIDLEAIGNVNLETACIKGVYNRLLLEDITYKEYLELPEFVKKDPKIIDRINSHLPLSFERKIIKRGSTHKERILNLKFEDFIPFSTDESLETTILRALEVIIKNQDADFTDIIFPKVILKHPQFKEIRKQAWLKAVLKYPTFYFAFPPDLVEKNIWAPQTTIDTKHLDTLNTWILRIENRPWYLESEKKVPKSVRYHEALLKAYLRGWGKILSKTPSQIWKKVNSHQRVYMSYAALRNFYIFSTLAKSFGPKGGGYSKASDRMKKITAYKIAYYYSTIINKSPKYSRINFYERPLELNNLDPQNKLIRLYLTHQFNPFASLVNIKSGQENYYFNKMDPNKP